MKKYYLIFLFIPLLFISLCSFVDSDTIDVYTGDIQYVSSSNSVTRLSGNITYYLDNYDDICLTTGGGLFNGSNSTYSGTAIISGTEYNIRFNARSELQIQQSYYSNNIERTEWVNYILYPDVVPSEYEFTDLSIIFIFIAVTVVGAVMIMRCDL